MSFSSFSNEKWIRQKIYRKSKHDFMFNYFFVENFVVYETM